jgi:ubiquinone/menaquinone biosynthesis C-methylase UbiE
MTHVSARARATYHAASDCYDRPALSFWGRFGRATVARLDLKEGQQVLDACCGTGASALPAAEVVGPGGRVLAVDLAPGLLEIGREKARQRGLGQVEFVEADIAELREMAESYDAVVCVFGIFFLPDMTGAVRSLWKLVRPGGQLAITTWGPRVFEPANSVFWQAVRDVRPELYKDFNPWDRISTPEALRALLGDAGVPLARAEASSSSHTLATPEDWWTIVMGSGYRGTVELLTDGEREAVRRAVRREIEDRQIRAIETNVVFATARKA